MSIIFTKDIHHKANNLHIKVDLFCYQVLSIISYKKANIGTRKQLEKYLVRLILATLGNVICTIIVLPTMFQSCFHNYLDFRTVTKLAKCCKLYS